MKSQAQNRFKIIDRGRKETMALIPGWATDYRILDFLDIKSNYLMPIEFSPFNFENDFIKKLEKEKITKISLYGYSLGGFLASQFASKYPDLIDRIILVSIRKKYKIEEIQGVRTNLNKNKKAYLYKFYRQCVYKKDRMKHFKENLLRHYIKGFDLDYLLNTLDYLGNAELKWDNLKGIRMIDVMHGEHDRIAPINEAMAIADMLPQATFTSVPGSSHLPFY